MTGHIGHLARETQRQDQLERAARARLAAQAPPRARRPRRPRRAPFAVAFPRLAGLAALALVALLLPAGARAATGFASTADPFTVTVGARTGSVTLARTSFAPSYGVAGAPDPQVDWGDGTTSTPSVPDVGSCISRFGACDLVDSHTYSHAGTYTVSIEYHTGCCISYSTSTTITVVRPSYVVASLGDSAASGEGAPDTAIDGDPTKHAVWSDGIGPYGSGAVNESKCHRSFHAAAAEAEAAIASENASAVTVSLQQQACSGATISGTVDQVHELTGHVDALVVLAGADDIDDGYANVIETCLAHDCTDPTLCSDGSHTAGCETLHQRIDADLSGLAAKFDTLAQAIASHPGGVGEVYVPEYFDPTTDANGGFGNDLTNFECSLDLLSADEWSWAQTTLVQGLNDRLRSAAARHGWVYVGGIADAFRGHGYCAWKAGQDWVVSAHGSPVIPESLWLQGDIRGTMHPNYTGQAMTADIVRRSIYQHTPPVTTLTALPPSIDDVVVHASATNRLPASGVSAIHYSVDGPLCAPSRIGACQTLPGATGSFVVSGVGDHTIFYFATNRYGGYEQPRQLTIHVPAVAGLPFVSATADGVPYTFGTWTHAGRVEVTLTPSNLDTVHVFYAVDTDCRPGHTSTCFVYEGPISISAEGSHTLAFWADNGFSGTSPVGALVVGVDRTAPQLALESRTPASAYGWNRAPVEVDWTCTDALSGPVTPTVTTTVSTEGAGQTATGACADNAGNSASAAEGGISVDLTPPTVTAAPARPPDGDGWYDAPVAVGWNGDDGLSGIVSCESGSGYAGPDTDDVKLTGTCTDRAGNAGVGAFHVRYDATAPTIAFVSRTAANAAGWNDGPVTLTWRCADARSGAPASVRRTVTTEGAGQSATGTCTDAAGNEASDTRGGISIDETAPTVTPQPSREADSNGWYNHPLGVAWHGDDGLSGLAACAPDSAYDGPDSGSASLSGSCTDVAGNAGAATYAFRYDATAPVIALVDRTPANASGWNDGDVTLTWSCADALSGAPATVTQTVAGEGVDQSATGTCTDAAGNSASDTQGGISIDRTAPSLACTASPSALWPPNHELVPVSVAVSLDDALSGPDRFWLTAATSSEPDDGDGDGDTTGDVADFEQGAPDVAGSLRAERAGGGSGREYTLAYRAVDRAGNAAECTTTVRVAKR